MQDSQNIAIYGENRSGFENDGIILDVMTQKVRPILGGRDDVKFGSTSVAQQINP